MPNRLNSLGIRNFRSLANIDIKTGALNILFGPNGAGKSTFLDTLWFVRDCAINGVDAASSSRSHGIGMRSDNADEGANIEIKIETNLAEYEIQAGYSSGRIEPYVGERLYAKDSRLSLIDRNTGSDQAEFCDEQDGQTALVPLRDPEKLALNSYLLFEDSPAASEIDQLLHFISFYPARAADLYRLKTDGSKLSYETRLHTRAQNLWSVLRNLNDKRAVDDRFNTITDFMRNSFPTFRELVIEQTGPNSVYASFVENGRHAQIQAAGVSDGHLQQLINLTALFAEGRDRESLILFDEPEISLHPYALSVFAEAAKLAATKWNKQIFVATHSPVLISQFEPEDIVAVEIDKNGGTILNRVSEIEGIRDLLRNYAVGSLYMAEMVASQSQLPS